MAHQQTRRRAFHDRPPFGPPPALTETLPRPTLDELETAYEVMEAIAAELSANPLGIVTRAYRLVLRLLYREILRAETVRPPQKPAETTSTPVAASVS